MLDLDTRGFLSTKGHQTIQIYANQDHIGTLQYTNDKRAQKASFPIPERVIHDARGQLTIKFEVEEPTSAKEVSPESTDTRKLGLGLHSLALRASGA